MWPFCAPKFPLPLMNLEILKQHQKYTVHFIANVMTFIFKVKFGVNFFLVTQTLAPIKAHICRRCESYSKQCNVNRLHPHSEVHTNMNLNYVYWKKVCVNLRS